MAAKVRGRPGHLAQGELLSLPLPKPLCLAMFEPHCIRTILAELEVLPVLPGSSECVCVASLGQFQVSSIPLPVHVYQCVRVDVGYPWQLSNMQ